MSLPLETAAGTSAVRISRVKYTHDGMIDLVIARPEISQNEIAATFGYTPAWVSIVFNSDAFQMRLAQRKEDVIDPVIKASIEERMKGLLQDAVSCVHDKILASQNAELAMEAIKATSRALGYGAKQGGSVNIHNFVAIMPPKAENSDEWNSRYAPRSPVILENGSGS